MMQFNQKYIEECLSKVHDGVINKLTFNYKGMLEIEIKSTNNTYNLIIEGIDRILINDFREGNIILDAEPYFSNEIEKSNIRKIYNDEDLATYFSNNKLFAIEINPSYGAQILISCEISGFQFHATK